jgi:hypothetical protein
LNTLYNLILTTARPYVKAGKKPNGISPGQLAPSCHSEGNEDNPEKVLEEVYHHWGKQAPSPKINQTKDETQNTCRYYSTRLLIAVSDGKDCA